MARTKTLRGTAGNRSPRKVRYAVVGLGHIAQNAVLPAFAHAKKNSVLAALVSDDPAKLKKLGKQYRVKRLYSYDQFNECITSGEIDAAYIALPNDMHRDYTIRAAQAGIHILCEKPMALTAGDCTAMIRAVEESNVRLMIAYRLHFEKANLSAISVVSQGKIGEPRIFNSVFCMQVKKGNIRVQSERGGGTLYDLGVYCINAARYLFRSEPVEVVAFTARQPNDERFREVDEMTSAIVRFPGDRLATFTSSFGAADVSSYQIVGTKGDLRLNPAYEYSGALTYTLTVNGKSKEKTFQARDQFAPELLYFSDCVLRKVQPEPSGREGLADVRVIEALYRSARSGTPVQLGDFPYRKPRPMPEQEISRPPVREHPMVHVDQPHE